MARSYRQATIPKKEVRCVSGGNPGQQMGLVSWVGGEEMKEGREGEREEGRMEGREGEMEGERKEGKGLCGWSSENGWR